LLKSRGLDCGLNKCPLQGSYVKGRAPGVVL
jgi:hypothetical protein